MDGNVVQEFIEAIKEPQVDTNKTYIASVSRIDNEGVVWVHVQGSEKETPTELSAAEVKAGDTVNVEWRNNKLYIATNVSNPSVGVMTVAPAVDYINLLEGKDISVNSIQAATGYIDELYSKNITTDSLVADHAVIKELDVESMSAATAYIRDLTSENITADDIIADHATIDTLDSTYATIEELHSDYAEIDLANVNNAWIEYGAMKKAEVFDENVFDLSGDHATLSKIDASKINVANLRADNLVVRRINGQPVVGGYTLIDSNSSGYASKNPQALGWYEFVNAQWVLSTDTTVDMTKAYYQTGGEVSLYDQTYIDGLETNLQQQIDGAVETFTGSVVPTLVNWPYTDWYDTSTTPVTDTRAKHVGDIYYVINSLLDEDGYCYRFAYDNTTHAYSWVLIKDSDVTKALADISDLQDFESTTTTWIDETDEGLETIRTNYTTLSGTVDKTVKESIQLWYTKANTTAPSKPTAEVTSTSTSGNAWRKVVPAYNASYPNYYYCWQYKFVDGTFDWSAVVRDIAMGETQGTARDAQTTANSNIKSSVQLWFTKANTTAPSKPTAQVTNSNATGSDSYNKWNLVVPIYNSSYPYYYYCYQQQKGDGTYQWSDVVYDQATSDSMKTAKEALPASTFTSFESTAFKDVKDTVTEHSIKFTNMTSRLGLNSDGTGANTDIVAKESALETTVDGISTRVGKTETKLIGMYATSSTAAGTAAKVATITPTLPSGATWELSTGTIITVKFTNANTTSSPTLNVNSKGAKAIKTYANGNLSEAEYKWAAGSTFTFVYNGTNWLMQDSSVSVRMNSAETSITQNAEQIQSKASQSSVDSLSGRVSTAESTITQQATAIEAKVSKDGVIASINASVEEQGGSAVRISADKVNIEGAAIFTGNGRLSSTSLDNAYDSKGSASTAESNAKGYTDTATSDMATNTSVASVYATKAAANAQEQLIYKSAVSGTASMSGTTTWITSTSDAQNAWTTKRPTYSSSYPVLFVATQRKSVGGTVTCTTPVKDDTTTIIDGGNIITGTVNANAVDASSGTFNVANIPNLNADKISAGTINIGRIPDGALNSNIEIGGRNLARETSSEWTEWVTPEPNTANKGFVYYKYAYLPDDKSVGDEYTCSYEIEFSGVTAGTGGDFRFRPQGSVDDVWTITNVWGSGANQAFPSANITTPPANGIYRYEGTAILQSNAVNATKFQCTFRADYWGSGKYRVRKIKVEKGNKATDWTPAPEDVTNENLLMDTQKMSSWYLGSGVSRDTTTEFGVITLNGTTADWNARMDSRPLLRTSILDGTQLWLSFEYTASVTTALNCLLCGSAANEGMLDTTRTKYGGKGHTIPAATSWTRYVVSMPVLLSDLATGSGDVNSLFVRFYNRTDSSELKVRKLKLEHGASATNWTPSPEEQKTYITRIDDAGIRIHPSNTANNSVVINASGMEVFKGGNSVAFYGDTARIGATANSKTRVELSNTAMDIISRNSSGTDTNVASFGSTARIGQTSETYVSITSTGTDAGIKFKTKGSGSATGLTIGDFGFNNNSGYTTEGWPQSAWYTLGYRIDTTYKGYYSIVAGYGCASTNNASFAGGIWSYAYGAGSIAFGYNAQTGISSQSSISSDQATYGEWSYAFGYGSHALGNRQFVIGQFNDYTNQTSSFVIGNGSSTSSRSNALWVDRTGNLYLAGNIIMESGSAKAPDVYYTPPASESYGVIIRLWGDGKPNYTHSADTYWLGVGSSGKLYTGTQLNGATAITWREK